MLYAYRCTATHIGVLVTPRLFVRVFARIRICVQYETSGRQQLCGRQQPVHFAGWCYLAYVHAQEGSISCSCVALALPSISCVGQSQMLSLRMLVPLLPKWFEF